MPGHAMRGASATEEISARIAQAVEHSLGKGEVTGSSPVVGTSFLVKFGFISKPERP